jgi:hypothetical protein
MASLRGRGGRLSPIYQLIANFVLVIAGLPWPETDSNLSGADLALPGLKAQGFLRLHNLNILILGLPGLHHSIHKRAVISCDVVSGV